MELTQAQLEAIREACRGVSFGRVTLEVNEKENKIDLITEKRIRVHRGRRRRS